MQILNQLLSIIKIVRPKHVINAVISPSHTVKVFKYHYRRVPEKTFIEFMANKWKHLPEEVDEAYQSYENNNMLWEEIIKNLSVYPNGYALQMTKECSTLYLLVRLIKPRCIIETGVSAGVSSTYILQALSDNQRGKLYSIDLPPENLPEGKPSGWVVPQYLRDRWALHVGDSKDLLEPLLKELTKIDCFIHDSLHTYDHMMWEFRTAWNHLRQGGLFLCHDVGANDAFVDFLKEKGIPWSDYRVFHVLGGFKKTE
jgi:predicted O-methyltransferase YrrM